MARARAQGESMSPPSDRKSGVKRNGIMFPSFFLLTVGYHSSFHTHYTIFPHVGATISSPEGNFHSLTVGKYGTFSLLTVGYTNNFKYGAGGNFPYSKLATLTISNMAPEGNFPYSQLATLTISNMAPEGGHVTGEVEGVILFLRKRLPPLGYASPLTTCVLSGGCYRLSFTLLPCD